MNQGSLFVVPKSRADAPYRLFCFPYAGGSAAAFFDWSERLGADIECVAIQYAGRGKRLRERPFVRIEEIVGEVRRNFALWNDKPFAFYGHSFGATVAFELSRQLSRSGAPTPFHLFAGAARPPHLERPFPPISQLPDEEFLEAVQTRYGGIPREIYADREVLEFFLPALRADFAAFETYSFEPGEPLEAPITVFSGDQDSMVSVDVLDQWAIHTNAGLDVTVLPGGHFFNGQSAAQLVRELQIRMRVHLKEVSA